MNLPTFLCLLSLTLTTESVPREKRSKTLFGVRTQFHANSFNLCADFFGLFGGNGGPGLPFLPFPGLAPSTRNPAYPHFPNTVSDCPTGDGNRTGICVANALECQRRGGRTLGSCYAPSPSGSGSSQQRPDHGIGFGGNIGGGYNPGIRVGVCCFSKFALILIFSRIARWHTKVD